MIMNDELEMKLKEAVMTYLKYYRTISLKGQRKIAETPRQSKWSLGQNRTRDLPITSVNHSTEHSLACCREIRPLRKHV
jgi:hypothetical protein